MRENDIELFGFRDERELSSFRMLLSVSGVGPRAALSILSIMTPEKFALAVCAEDRKAISKAPGIGPKTAARIILELKDKLMKETHMDDSDLSAAITDHTAEAAGAPARGKLSEAQDALLVLGYTRAEAQSALRSIDIAALSLEDIIKEALKNVAMQIAALHPQYVCDSEVPEEFKEHEIEIIKAQIANDPKVAGKPEKVIEGMIQGKLNKELKEICLNDQVYVKAEDGKQSVSAYLAQVGKANNANLSVKKFVRFERGEGMEKKQENFAEEVAKQMNM